MRAQSLSHLVRMAFSIEAEGFVRLNRQDMVDQRRPRLSRGALTPFGERGSAVVFENVSTVEGAVLVEVVVERGMDGSELLKGLHVPELRHRH